MTKRKRKRIKTQQVRQQHNGRPEEEIPITKTPVTHVDLGLGNTLGGVYQLLSEDPSVDRVRGILPNIKPSLDACVSSLGQTFETLVGGSQEESTKATFQFLEMCRGDDRNIYALCARDDAAGAVNLFMGEIKFRVDAGGTQAYFLRNAMATYHIASAISTSYIDQEGLR